ncbi:hypothetical protein V2J09_021276 [Rumex salicifolius]
MAMAEEVDETWRREKIHHVLKLVSTWLPQRDLLSLLLVNSLLYRYLVSYPSLWQELDLHEMSNAGNRLLSALSLPRYADVKSINLEFAQDIEDKHLELVGEKISDKGVESITRACPNLKIFSIYWNVRVTDAGIMHLTKHCKHIVDLNLSDKTLQLVAYKYQHLELLNITRCMKVTDGGLQKVLHKSSSLRSLNLYALSSVLPNPYELQPAIGTEDGMTYYHVPEKQIKRSECIRDLVHCLSRFVVFFATYLCGAHGLMILKSNMNAYCNSSAIISDQAYKKISLLANLEFLDLCGAQNLTDEGLKCIAKCKTLVSLNLTWCVQITDVGISAIAQSCTVLEFLSLFGIVGVTDKSLVNLSRSCSRTLKTLDVNGCVNIKRRSHEDLLKMFPHLQCFKVHS